MAKKRTPTQKLRTNVLSAIRRRKDKYGDIPSDFIESIKSAPYSTLKSYQRNRYSRLDKELRNLISEASVTSFGPTTITPPAPPSTASRKELALDEALKNAGVDRSNKDAVNHFNKLIDKALSYKDVNHIQTEYDSLAINDYRRTELGQLLQFALKTPSLYNELQSNTEQPNANNTADSKELLYTEIMTMIDDALGGGSKWEKYLADYLKNTLQEELDRYAGEQWKVYKAIENGGSWLYDSCWAYIYDSDNLEGKKARLEAIMSQIHGNLPSDEELSTLSDYSDLYDGWEE